MTVPQCRNSMPVTQLSASQLSAAGEKIRSRLGVLLPPASSVTGLVSSLGGPVSYKKVLSGNSSSQLNKLKAWWSKKRYTGAKTVLRQAEHCLPSVLSGLCCCCCKAAVLVSLLLLLI